MREVEERIFELAWLLERFAACCSECSAFTLSGKIFECIDVALRCLVQAMQLEFFPSELYMYIPYVHMCDKLSNVPGLHSLVCRMFVTTFS